MKELKQKTKDLLNILKLIIFLNIFVEVIHGVGLLFAFGIISFCLVYIFFINFLLEN